MTPETRSQSTPRMFRALLTQTVNQVPGAVGALFLDWEGESVEVVTRTSSPYELKIVGAYQGIFLSQIQRITSEAGLGSPQRFKLEFQGVRILNWVLKDGYYVVLIVGREVAEGPAWRELFFLRDQLMKEL